MSCVSKPSWDKAPAWAKLILKGRYSGTYVFACGLSDGALAWPRLDMRDGETFFLEKGSWEVVEERPKEGHWADAPKPPASSTQVGGGHYKDLPIQPIEYCQKNELNAIESFVVKYVTRHRNKNGAEDIKKAIHCLELLLEIEYESK